MLETQLLYALHKYKDGYISGEELAGEFKVSRTSVWNYIDYFRKQGYAIEAHPNLGYRLIEIPDRMLPDEVQYGLDTKIVGKKICAYEETGSTNDVALEMANKGEPEGSVIFAESQTKGRGRLKRQWYSPKRKGLWFSLILRPDMSPQYAPIITACGAVAVAKAVGSFTGLSVWIKWPNDIFVNGKKVGGILTELSTEIDSVKFVIIGIGINVNGTKWPEELKNIATSLEEEGGRKYSRIDLSREILKSLDYYYGLIRKKYFQEIIEEWKNMSLVLGRRVRVNQGSEKYEAQAMGMDEQGALIVRTDDGFTKHIMSGDVICC